ncbi:hypothetical protein F4780DRAFT_781089 [Xylariomycetidae sp. FL0641]|nr:hypothetical protein F4780DRAFT_781089 [Xylariomycetidae sp. FL0641]
MEENLDENAVRELEDVLQIKIYPGMEIMEDIGPHHFVKSGRRSADVLVPQPSDDPHDPLNGSPMSKAITLFCATVMFFRPARACAHVRFKWHRSLADVVQFTGVAILVLGFSNFSWVPVSVCYGRRPVMTLSSLIQAASATWHARVTSNESFMGASV